MSMSIFLLVGVGWSFWNLSIKCEVKAISQYTGVYDKIVKCGFTFLYNIV